MKKLALSGMLVTRDKIESMGKQLGISTKNSVTEIVSERERNHLQQVVEERAKAMNAIFQRIATDVKIVSDATANILANPNLYPQQELRYSQSIEEGWAVSLAVDPSAVDNLENLRGRIALAANIQDVLKSMVLAYDVNCSMYTAFEDGFDIVFDTTESDMKAHYFDNPNPYRIFNFLDRPWYKNAKEKQKIVFTDALLNVNSLAASTFVACSGPIMVNGNFVGVTGFGFESEDIEKIVFQTKVGETGFGFILNRNGQVILSPQVEGILSVQSGFPDLRDSSEKSLAEAAEKMARGEKGILPLVVNGDKYILAFEPLENIPWSFGAVMKVDEVTAPAENLAISIDERTDEFVDEAENLSARLLPFTIGALITIADVSGKGVPAALFMMQGKTILKNLAMTMQNPNDLAAVMALANNQLCQGNDEMMFITVFVAMLDLKTGKLIYVNGGHNPPMLYREDEKKFRYIDVEQNCVLGLMDEMDFVQQETQMNPYDIIYLYTDGVTEAMNKNREQYGEERLENCLNSTDHQCNLQTLLDSVKKSLAQHVQDAEQSDDITMLSVRLK